MAGTARLAGTGRGDARPGRHQGCLSVSSGLGWAYPRSAERSFRVSLELLATLEPSRDNGALIPALVALIPALVALIPALVVLLNGLVCLQALYPDQIRSFYKVRIGATETSID